ncbi:MAG: FKBP-type peptidyl-prolyl cis-trans isomerase [Ginsengibacter sp.]
MLKKIFSVLAIASLVITSCAKKTGTCSYNESKVIAPAAEIDSLRTLLKDSGITAIQNTAGFFYTINQPGSGTSVVNLCSNVTVTYKGTFFTGQTFDATGIDSTVTPPQPVPVTIALGQLIIGWQKGIPIIKKDGDITLYIPPSLAYGSVPATDRYGNVVIPANSYLKFEIHLVDIQ